MQWSKGQTMVYKTLHRLGNMNFTKTKGELMSSGRTNSSCSTSGTCRVTLVTNPAQ